ncbi:MAG TPA: hypothetical protein VFX91_13555 [Alcanivorax sp.]|nr:hypothetical protein [Alcanivorax sp.]
MLSRFKIGTRLGGAFAVILILLLAASATGLFSVTRIAETTRDALQTDGALASNAGVVRRLALELRRYEKDVFINMADRAICASASWPPGGMSRRNYCKPWRR